MMFFHAGKACCGIMCSFVDRFSAASLDFFLHCHDEERIAGNEEQGQDHNSQERLHPCKIKD